MLPRSRSCPGAESDTVISKAADGDRTALALCRETFEKTVAQAERDVSADNLSAVERSQLTFADPGKVLSVAEKGGIVAGVRAPTLYTLYSKAVSHGIAR